MAESVIEYIAEQAVRHTPTLGPGTGGRLVREMREAKKFDARRDLHLDRLAKKCYGEHAFESKLRQLVGLRQAGWVAEGTESVDHTAFRDILGPVAVEAIEAGYTQVDTPVDELVATVDGGMDPFNPKLYPYKAAASEPSQDVAPNMPYPQTKFTGYKIKSPVPVKHGLITQLNIETVKANDRLGFLDALAEVGRVVRLAEVRKKLRPVLGIVNNWTTVSAAGVETAASTYTATGRANLVVDLNLANGPQELDRLQRVFAAQTHPLTGEPIDVGTMDVFTVRNNLFSLNKAAGVKEVRTTTGGVQYLAANPGPSLGKILSDVRAYNMLIAEAGVEGTALSAAEASTFSVFGNFQKAFAWRQVEPFSVFEAGPGDANEGDFVTWPPAFFQDIVYAAKARIWGAAFTRDPYEVMAAYDQD